MNGLAYKKISTASIDEYEELYLCSSTYYVTNLYEDESIKPNFLMLKANVVDLDKSSVIKSVQGTEQDFAHLMTKAKEFINISLRLENDSRGGILLDLFQDCVFGYYVLTPLIEAKEISDIKVYDWNHITVKKNGERYITNLKFSSPDDYSQWFERIMRIQRLNMDEYNMLQHCTDRRGIKDFYLRIDLELKDIVSAGVSNIHIRKIPKEKYTLDYLKDNGMLNDEMDAYLKDRIPNQYNFLLSGRGGSGKTSLLNYMVDLIPYNESGLVVQESDELYSLTHPQLQFEHTVEINRNGKVISYTLEDSLRLGLLQDIDRFIIGEIKGGEALNVFTTGLNTGAVFWGTIHSNSAVDSVRRLSQLAKYVSDYPIATLEEMLANMRFSLIYMQNFSIWEIYEINGWSTKTSQLVFSEIYTKKEIRI